MNEKLLQTIATQKAMIAAQVEYICALYNTIWILLSLLILCAVGNLFFSYYVEIINFFKKWY